MTHNEDFLALVKDALTRIKEINILDLIHKLEAKEKLYLIDVREDHEWTGGHLPDAMHISKGTLERDIESILPEKDVHIVLYCGGGYRSALAADALQKMGYTQVESLQGGFKAWIAAGLPVV